MKNKKRRNAIALLALFVIYYFAKKLMPTTEGLTYPPYTSFSTNYVGTALFYDTLKTMGYPVNRDTIFIDKDRPLDNVQIIIAPDYSYTGTGYREDITDWVIQGGTLLYFTASFYESSPLSAYAEKDLILIDESDAGSLYHLGLGKFFTGNAKHITNKGLLEGGDVYAQQIANMLNNLSYNKIHFNEAYHGYGTDKSLFESLPPGVRLLGLQLLLLSLAAIIYFGKRFGRIIPYYEEIEREENEYVFTLTNLYMSIGLGSAAVDVYEKKFKKACGSYFRNSDMPEFFEILDFWKNESLPCMDKLEYVAGNQDYAFNTKRPAGRREFTKAISYYKELINIITKL